MAPQNTIHFSLADGCAHTIEIQDSEHAHMIKDVVILISQFISSPVYAESSLRFAVMHEAPYCKLLPLVGEDEDAEEGGAKFEMLRDPCPCRDEMEGESESGSVSEIESDGAMDEGHEDEEEGYDLQQQLMLVAALAHRLYVDHVQNAPRLAGEITPKVDAALRQQCFEHAQRQLEVMHRAKHSAAREEEKKEEEEEEEEERPRSGKYPRLTVATASVAEARNQRTEEHIEDQENHRGALYWQKKHSELCKKFIHHTKIWEIRCEGMSHIDADLNQRIDSLDEQILRYEEAYEEMGKIANNRSRKVESLQRQLEKATMYKGKEVKRLENDLQRRHELAGDVCDGYERVLRKQDARLKEFEGMLEGRGIETAKEVSEKQMQEEEKEEASLVRKRKILLISPR